MAINWIRKCGRGRGLNCDVRINVAGNGNKNGYYTHITFSNRWGETISKTGCIMVGIDGSKIYFKDDSDGYKLCTNGSGSGESTRLKVKGKELLEIARERGGDYKLNKDKINGLWFIETNVDNSFDKYK